LVEFEDTKGVHFLLFEYEFELGRRTLNLARFTTLPKLKLSTDKLLHISVTNIRIPEVLKTYRYQRRIQGEGRTRPPPPKIGKNMIFWRKIVIFHRKYPKNVRASLRSAHFF
jgi:hypothetical protein